MNLSLAAINPAIRKHKEHAYIILLVFCLALSILALPLRYMLLAAIILLFIPLVYYRFDWAFFFAIGIMPITRIPRVTEFVEPLKYFLLLTVLASWLVKKIFSTDKNKWLFIKLNPYNTLIILFSLLILMASIVSNEPKLTIKALFTHFIIFCYLYLFLDIFQSKDYVKKVIYALIIPALFVATVAIMQYIVVQFQIFSGLQRLLLPPVHRQFISYGYGFETFFTLGGYRSVGTFYHSNLLGVYLAMIFPFTASLFFYVKTNRQRIALALATMVLLGGIFCSGSRGGFLNILFASGFLFIVYRKKIPLNVILACLLVFVCAFAVFSRHIISYLRLIEGISFRDIIWSNSLEMVKNSPFIGNGLGAFATNYTHNFGFPSVIDLEYFLNELTVVGSSESMVGFTAHNLFLNYAVETGIFGVILILCWYSIYFKKASQALLFKNNFNFSYAIFIGATASIIGNFTHSFFEAITNFNHLPLGILFILILSIGLLFISSGNSKTHVQE